MKKNYYSFVGIYTFSYAAIGMLFPLIGQYLEEIGFTGVEIGLITAMATATGIMASPFWGWRYHHSPDGMRVVLFLCFSAVIVVISLIFIRHYLIFLMLYALFSFFQSPIMPLSDAMTLEAGNPFGAVRKWGAIGFAVGVFVAGQIADAVDLIVIFPLCALSFSISWFIIFKLFLQKKGGTELQMPVNEGQPETAGDMECKKFGYGVLLRNKKLMALLFSAFFICGTNVANNTYFGFLYTNVGGGIAGIGVAFLLMCGSEAPFMAWIERISGKFTLEKMILISMCISALRYFWYSTGPAPALLIGTFFLQGMVNGVVLIEFVRYISKLVDPGMIGMAMTLYQAISSNCSTILCQLIGGMILEHYSGTEVYFFFGIYNTIGIILYVGFGLHKSKSKKV
jgi:Major Facilitator Superfamily.